MDNTDYCSYEIARKLKECGFREKCLGYYQLDFPHLCFGISQDHNNVELTLSAPLLWEAQKWLREEKGIDIDVRTSRIGGRRYDFVVHDGTKQNFSSEYYKIYESALEAAISAALELIGKKD